MIQLADFSSLRKVVAHICPNKAMRQQVPSILIVPSSLIIFSPHCLVYSTLISFHPEPALFLSSLYSSFWVYITTQAKNTR